MRRAAFLLAIYLLTSANSPGANSDPWLHLHSANFDLYTDAGEGSARNIIRNMERVHSFFEKAGFGSTGTTTYLIAFRSDKEYQAYRPNAVAVAYFQPGYLRDYIVSTASTLNDHPETAVHEYTHLMVHQSKKQIPIWFNEGLAEVYASMRPEGKKMLVGAPIAGHLITLANEQWIGLDKLTSADHQSPLYNEKNRAGVFYAESWLLVHMLFLDANYRPHFRDMSLALEDLGAAGAFPKAYGKSLAEVYKDLQAYGRRSSVSAVLFDVELPKSSEAPDVEPAASLPARLLLAGMQADSGKLDPAQSALKEIETDFPKRWEVERGWAEYYLRSRDIKQVIAHYAKAVDLGCNDPRSLLEYGKALGYDGRHKDAAAVLEKAVDTAPSNTEAILELGMARVRAGEYGNAIVTFHQLKSIDKSTAWRYFYHSGYAIMELGDLSQAQSLADKAKQYAKDPQEQYATTQLNDAIDTRRRRLEAQASAKARADARAAQQAAAPPLPSPTETVDPTRDEPPTLRHKDSTAADSTTREQGLIRSVLSKLPTAEGPLRSIDCHNGQLTLHVGLGGGERLFLIDDPKKVLITSGGPPIDVNCGPQKNQTILIRYQSAPADSPQFAGVIRGLEFK